MTLPGEGGRGGADPSLAGARAQLEAEVAAYEAASEDLGEAAEAEGVEVGETTGIAAGKVVTGAAEAAGENNLLRLLLLDLVWQEVRLYHLLPSLTFQTKDS
jgi:hypothetical protein